jgi:hypothetical protein
MSVDLRARRAMDELRSEVALLDVDRAFDHVLTGGRRNGLVRSSLVLAAVVVVAMVGGIIAGGPMQSNTPPPPANQSKSATIGVDLPGPATMRLPAGWDIAHDGRYVELIPQDGSDARLVVTIPAEVYDPPSYDSAPLREDLVVWTLTHPAIQSAERYGIYEYGRPQAEGGISWGGNAMDLSLRTRGSELGSVPLVPLPGAAGDARLSVTSQDATFRWAVVNLKGSEPIAFAAISVTSDDQLTLAALNDLLQSIHATPTR